MTTRKKTALTIALIDTTIQWTNCNIKIDIAAGRRKMNADGRGEA